MDIEWVSFIFSAVGLFQYMSLYHGSSRAKQTLILNAGYNLNQRDKKRNLKNLRNSYFSFPRKQYYYFPRSLNIFDTLLRHVGFQVGLDAIYEWQRSRHPATLDISGRGFEGTLRWEKIRLAEEARQKALKEARGVNLFTLLLERTRVSNYI